MKRLWLALLSLGLVLAFSASAMAVDVKFSGDFQIAGMYLDKTNLMKDTGNDGTSTAFYYQRLRVQTDFVVSPGLKLVTRFDAMERIWGGARSDVPLVTTQDSQSAGTRAENENIAFDWAYIQYTSPIGIFMVGYGPDNYWGTTFGDSASGHPTGQMSWMLPVGNAIVGAMYFKEADLSKTAVTPSVTTDNDADKYVLWGLYNFTKDINAGLLYIYYRGADAKATGPYLFKAQYLLPYVKAKIGPVSIEAEVQYGWGNILMEDGIVGADKTVSDLTAYVNAVADFGIVYVGGTFAYLSGDDPGTTDKIEGGGITALNGGMDWNPCLIMFNQDRTYWVGAITGYSATADASPMTNAWFGQGKVGVRPIAKLDINASLSYAQADKKPLGVINSSYGYEVDVTGTYKITNNLSYMLGVGYWFVGDYYKGSTTNSLKDEYMVINKLTLTF